MQLIINKPNAPFFPQIVYWHFVKFSISVSETAAIFNQYSAAIPPPPGEVFQDFGRIYTPVFNRFQVSVSASGPNANIAPFNCENPSAKLFIKKLIN